MTDLPPVPQPEPPAPPPAPPIAYSTLQKRLHWAVMALVAAQFTLFHGIDRAFGHAMKGGDAGGPVVTAHALAGLAILGLMLWRLALVRKAGAVALPADEPDWAVSLARAAHAAFYALLIAMPVLGMLALGLHIGPAAGLHKLAASLVLALIGLHVGAVALHHLLWNRPVLKRMT